MNSISEKEIEDSRASLVVNRQGQYLAVLLRTEFAVVTLLHDTDRCEDVLFIEGLRIFLITVSS